MLVKKIILGILLSTIVILSGCATVQNYEWAVHSWEGAPAHALLQRWGHPNQTEQLANGRQVYLYHTAARGTYATPGTGISGVLPARSDAAMISLRVPYGGSYAFECKTWFEVNKNGRIVHVSFRGNDCVFSEKKARARSYLKHRS